MKILVAILFILLISGCGGGGGGAGGGLIPSFNSFTIDALLPNAAVDINDYLDGTTGPYIVNIVSGPGTVDGSGNVTASGAANFDVIIVGVTDSAGNFIKVRVPVIGNPINWFDAKNIGSSLVDIWPDGSTNANHATANCVADECPVTSATTINDKAVVTFDGINDRLIFQSSGARNDVTVFVLFKTNAGLNNGTNWFDKAGLLSNYNGVGGHFDLGISIGDSGEMISGFRHGGGTTNMPSVAGYNDDVGHLLVSARNQATGDVNQLIDAKISVTAAGVTSVLTDNPLVDFSIGSQNDGTNFYQGDIGEIIIYGDNLTDDERQIVERYLKDKFDFAVDPAILPAVTIDTVPADPTDNNLSFGYTITPSAYFDIESVECRLGGAWSSCNGKTVLDLFGMIPIVDTKTYDGASDGSYTFEIRVTDSDGRIATDTHAFVVDTSPPVCTISYPVDGSYIPVNNPTAAFACSDDNTIVSVKCDINDAELWNDCTSVTSQVFAGLNTDDVTKLEVKAQDQYGLWSAITTTTWTTDLDAPTCIFTTEPSGVQTDLNESFVYACSDNNPFPGSVECSVDGGAFVSCGSDTNFSLTNLSADDHTLVIRVIDIAGIVETQLASWTTDLTGPACSFSGPFGEGGFSSEVAPTILFDCTDDNPITNDVQCSLDGGVAADCSTNTTSILAGLIEGAHDILISVSDIAANPTSTTLNWSVDLTDPSCVFTVEESGEVNSPLAHFEYTCSDPTSAGVTSGVDKVECSFDGGAYIDCDSQVMHDYIALADAVHTLRVQPIDVAGNIGAFIEATWTTAATPPTISGNYPDGVYPSSVFLELTPSKTVTMYYCMSTVATCDPKAVGILYVTPVETSGANDDYSISYYAIDLTTQESIIYTNLYTIDRFEYVTDRMGGSLSANGSNHLEINGGLLPFGFFRGGAELGAGFETGEYEHDVTGQKLKIGFDNIIN